MHWQAFSFVSTVKSVYPAYFYDSSVIEFGSAYVNASIRNLFSNPYQYYGLDLSKTKGVDIVYDGINVFISNNFDIALSCECFEHNPNYLATFENMVNHTKPGGMILFTCATTGRAEHGTSRTSPEQSPGTQSVGIDYYRNLTKEDFNLDYIEKEFESYLFCQNRSSFDLYFVGIKRGKSKYSKSELEKNSNTIYNTVLQLEDLSFCIESLWANSTHDNASTFLDLLAKLPVDALNPYIFENVVGKIYSLLSNEQIDNLITLVRRQNDIYPNVFFTYSNLYILFREKGDFTMAHSFALKYFNESKSSLALYYLFESYISLKLPGSALKLSTDNQRNLKEGTPRWILERIELLSKKITDM